MGKSEISRTGALSARARRWQSQHFGKAAGIGAILAAAMAGLAPMNALAGQDGPLGTMKRGYYACELPGNAMIRAGIHQPDEDFTILQSSLYSSPGGRGSYLLTGDWIVMTSGPKKGEKFRRISENFMRKLNAQGKDTELRCVRTVLNNRPD